MIKVKGKEILTTLEELVDSQHTALLLIDLQNDFMTPGGHFDRISDCSALRAIVPGVKMVLEAARSRRILVVHVQMTFYADFLAQSPVALYKQLVRLGDKSARAARQLQPYCLEGTWGWQVVDELAPLPNELIVRKHRSSAFVGTDLDMLLRSNGIKSVVTGGVVTHGCVFATLSDAPLFEYYPVVLEDCVASRSQKLHDAAMLLMDGTKEIVKSDAVLKIWNARRRNPSRGNGGRAA